MRLRRVSSCELRVASGEWRVAGRETVAQAVVQVVKYAVKRIFLTDDCPFWDRRNSKVVSLFDKSLFDMSLVLMSLRPTSLGTRRQSPPSVSPRSCLLVSSLVKWRRIAAIESGKIFAGFTCRGTPGQVHFIDARGKTIHRGHRETGMVNSTVLSAKTYKQLIAVLFVMVALLANQNLMPQLAAQPPAKVKTAAASKASAGSNVANASSKSKKSTRVEAKKKDTAEEQVRSELSDSQFLGDLAKAKSAADANAALSALATAQRDAGKPAAAIAAAIQIPDDELRSQILAQQQPPRGQRFGLPQRGNNRRRQGNGNNGNNGNNPNAGGGAQADFDTLIDLITTTVSPESWEDVGGTGSAAGFPGGVLIEPKGLMRRGETGKEANRARRLKSQIRKKLASKLGRDEFAASVESSQDGHANEGSANGENGANDGDSAKAGTVRSISLPRLETALMARQAAGLPPTPEMLALAGLDRIQYVMIYPDSHDVVLVGTFHDEYGPEAQHRLSDLAVLFDAVKNGNGQMVCSITPRQKNLAATQAFLKESATRALKPGERQLWLDTIQSKLGRQDIEFSGVDPRTHVAQVLIAADYHMKLVGMGLEPGVDGVESYLNSIELAEDGTLPPMNVLRWWFTLRDAAVTTNGDQTTFGIPDRLVQVQSENEMLSDRGARIHTGASEPLNRRFAASFTEHYVLLAEKYQIYADLRHVFETSVAASLIVDQRMEKDAGWQPTLLANPDGWLSHDQPAAKEVESVVAHRVIDRRHVVAGISGGVDLAPRRDLQQPTTASDVAQLDKIRAAKQPENDRHQSPATAIRWWW